MPGGFGKRGIEGMLKGIQYARENKVPYFGICLGMQTACIEFARNVCGLEQANSSEFDPATPHRVIYKLRELRGVEELGGTMRLGAWPCRLEPGSLAHRGLRPGRDQRAPPPSLRIQSRVRRAADRRRIAHQRSHARRYLRRDRRDSATIPSSSAASSIPSSSRSRWSRIRCSRPSSRHRMKTRRSAGAERHDESVEMFHRPEKVKH